MISRITSLPDTVNHNHKHGCAKCNVIGEWNHISRTVVFTKLDAQLRTDAEFREGKYLGTHQKGSTPLLELPIDMIADFPVADCLHLCDLGITKRLIVGWIEGTLGNVDAKWSSRETLIVSGLLGSIKAPAEIRSQRAVRDFSIIKKWKAIEFRNFGLYLGVVALKGNLKDYIYKHFLLYFCALTIFSSEYHLKQLFTIGESCLKVFVERYKNIYGPQYFTSNVHNLTHLSNDVKRFGALNTISAYPFESKLFRIGRLLRTGNLPLSQVAKRLIELDSIESECEKAKTTSKKYAVKNNRSIKLRQLNNLLENGYELYSYLELPKLKLFCDRDEDKWVLLDNMSIFEVQHIVIYMGRCLIYGTSLKNVEDFFTLPIKSSHLFIFRTKKIERNSEELYSIDDIKCKLFEIQREEKFIIDEEDPDKNLHVFLPILGTLK